MYNRYSETLPLPKICISTKVKPVQVLVLRSWPSCFFSSFMSSAWYSLLQVEANAFSFLCLFVLSAGKRPSRQVVVETCSCFMQRNYA